MSDPKPIEKQASPELVETGIQELQDTATLSRDGEHASTEKKDNSNIAPKFIGGKYRVLQLLGKGGMGAVYKVQHVSLDKVYAAKVLNSDVLTDFKLLNRFDQEAKSVGSLNHPNLISVHDYGTSDDGTPYLIMDFLDGHSLDEEIRANGPLEEKRALYLFGLVCDALKHAHEKGIIHRDIKPSNIMLVKTEDGSEGVKIVDFGIARRELIDNKVTQTGEVFGTPLYMSPEQCVGKHCDARSDIYSLGCVMYEALTGITPFAAENAVQTILNHINEAPAPIRKVNSKLSPGIEQLVAACLQKAPEDRIESAEVLAINLRRMAFGKNPILNSVLLKRKKESSDKLKNIVPMLLIVLFVFFIGYKINDSGTSQGSRVDTRPFAVLLDTGVNETKRGEYSKAVATLEKGLEIARAENAPDIYQLRYLQYLTSANYHLHDYPKARIAARAVAEMHLKHNEYIAADSYAGRVWRYARSGDKQALPESVDFAIKVREKALGVKSAELFEPLLQRAWNLDRAGKTKEAISDLERALELANNNPRKVTMLNKYLAYDRLTNYLKKTGQNKRALAVLDQALASTADAPEETVDRLEQRRINLRQNASDLGSKH